MSNVDCSKGSKKNPKTLIFNCMIPLINGMVISKKYATAINPKNVNNTLYEIFFVITNIFDFDKLGCSLSGLPLVKFLSFSSH
jgi:hypothetical protein